MSRTGTRPGGPHGLSRHAAPGGRLRPLRGRLAVVAQLGGDPRARRAAQRLHLPRPRHQPARHVQAHRGRAPPPPAAARRSASRGCAARARPASYLHLALRARSRRSRVRLAPRATPPRGASRHALLRARRAPRRACPRRRPGRSSSRAAERGRRGPARGGSASSSALRDAAERASGAGAPSRPRCGAPAASSPASAPRSIPYQVEGVAFLASRGRALLADDMGLGKTAQAIAAMVRLDAHGRRAPHARSSARRRSSTSGSARSSASPGSARARAAWSAAAREERRAPTPPAREVLITSYELARADERELVRARAGPRSSSTRRSASRTGARAPPTR